MTTVALDISSLNHQQISGVGIYTLQLLKALKQAPELNVTAVWKTSRWKYRRFFKQHAGRTRPWLFGLGVKADVLHGPDFRVLRAPGFARVVTIHDLAFLTEGMTSPEFARKKKRDLDRLLDVSCPDALIAISEATRRDLLRYRPELEPRVHVVHLGGDHLRDENTELLLPENYFLFVGNLETRKNVLGILRAFESFAAKGDPSTRLKLIGKPGYEGDKIIAAIDESPVRSRIDLTGYCELSSLRNYYRQALGLVYPSWIEGFGLPVIEAMHLGCPVITSNGTSTAEIAGDAALLVDPQDTSAIARAMEKVAGFTNDQRREQIKRARDRALVFTWKKCAEETRLVYEAAGRRYS